MNETDHCAEAIFAEAIELATPADRTAFLERACAGHDDLRQAVEKLVEDHFRAGSFLESPAFDFAATADVSAITESPGAVIGPYKLLQQIGEGGMGVVFMAEQSAPIHRTVALKIIKPGMDTRQVIARFEAERQALAMMDHPNIAKVLDAGTTDTGRPYFVMELVKGVPITKYCDDKQLSLRERLELFLPVCQAVQHAHQKGIIHRDIKPTNVVVAEYDNQAIPKVIDFGVAKATAQKLTERTMFTEFGQVIGTVEYMSPEQAKFNQVDIDTRSDIYSLGVLLYELLTGSTPFEQQRLREVAFDEVLRIIREEEPPKPSTRLSSLSLAERTGARMPSTLASVAANRHTEPARLSKDLRGELDWIVMKALEKDRNRRYETPNSLVRDIERYLHDERVHACPPSAAYRLKKFVRRNKIAAAFVALLLFSVVGLSVSNIAFRRERDAKAAALARAQVVSDLLQEMLASADTSRTKGRDYTVRQLLDDSSAMLGNQLAGLPDAEADIRATIGAAYRSLGMSELAQPHLERAVQLARKIYGPEHERLAAILVDYAWTLEHQDKYTEAEPFLHEALDIYRKRGITGAEFFRALRVLQDLLITSLRYEDAEHVSREAMAIANGSGQEFAGFASILHQYADLQIRLGNFAKAEEIAQRAIQMHRRIHDDNRDTALALSRLAAALESQNKFEQAEKTLSESLTILRRFSDEDHPDVRDKIERLKAIAKARGQQ